MKHGLEYKKSSKSFSLFQTSAKTTFLFVPERNHFSGFFCFLNTFSLKLSEFLWWNAHLRVGRRKLSVNLDGKQRCREMFLLPSYFFLFRMILINIFDFRMKLPSSIESFRHFHNANKSLPNIDIRRSYQFWRQPFPKVFICDWLCPW